MWSLRLMDVCEARPSVHFYAVDVQGNTYSNGSKKATAVSTYQTPSASHPGPYRPAATHQQSGARHSARQASA